jgi:hypothetical protein
MKLHNMFLIMCMMYWHNNAIGIVTVLRKAAARCIKPITRCKKSSRSSVRKKIIVNKPSEDDRIHETISNHYERTTGIFLKDPR